MNESRYSFMTDDKLNSTQKIILTNYFQKHITSAGSIARGISWPTEQVFNYLATLCRMGYLERVSRGEYVLSSKYQSLQTITSSTPEVCPSQTSKPKLGRPFSGEFESIVLKLTQEGLSPKEIAAKTGYALGSVYNTRAGLSAKGMLPRVKPATVIAQKQPVEISASSMDFFFELLSRRDESNEVEIDYKQFTGAPPSDSLFETLRVHKMIRELAQKGLIEWDAKSNRVRFDNEVLSKIA